MRIAIYHNLPSGGAKRVLYESVRRMVADHHIDVYSLSTANHEFCDLRPFVANHRIYDFEPSPLLSSPFGRLNQGFRLVDLQRLNNLTKVIAENIEAGDYDVALIEPCQFEIAPSIIKHLSIPTAYYCQEPLRRLYETMPDRPYDQKKAAWKTNLDRLDPLPPLYHRVLKRNDRANTQAAGRVLVNSKFIQESVRKIYQTSAQVCYLAVDTDLFRPLDVDKRPILYSVGSLTPLKGFDFLIRAVGLIPLDQRPALVITSNFQNPPEREYLNQLATGNGVQLELLNDISEAELVALYNQAEITVYSPVREPFGLVALESMACGTPVIGIREGGLQETIRHEETGLLIDRDPQKFADAIVALRSSPEKMSSFGRRSREHVLANWSWDFAVQTLENHLKAIINGVSNEKIPAY